MFFIFFPGVFPKWKFDLFSAASISSTSVTRGTRQAGGGPRGVPVHRGGGLGRVGVGGPAGHRQDRRRGLKGGGRAAGFGEEGGGLGLKEMWGEGVGWRRWVSGLVWG